LGLELMPLLALGSALLLANGFQRRRDLGLVLVGLAAIGYGASARGFYDFAASQSAHTKNSYTLAVPGMVALFFVNSALRSRTRLSALGWSALSLPLFFEQFITFGRGLWTGCLAGIAVSALIFGGLGRGSAARWGRAALVVGILAGAGAIGAIQAAVVLGRTEMLQEAGTRLTSITGTEIEYETRSNLIRLGEYLVVVELIGQAPWFGHGVGYTFLVKQAFTHEANAQWGVHQNFLMIWLKQGLIGVVLFVWMLSAAIALGAREARRRTDPLESTWFATTAAATAFLVVFSLSNYPFAVVNETFLLALLWGVAMAMTRQGFVSIRWAATAGTAGSHGDDRLESAGAGPAPRV
jgi:O-antigen ligase